MGLLGPIHDFLLVLLGSSLILGGIGVVLLTNTIHSAFSLGLVLVCISLFYILSNSHLVAAAQLLIYVGAINVLIIFAVMFMNGSEYYKDLNLWTVGDGVTLLICTILFCLLMATISNTSCQQIGIHLSTDFFLPFELISIILLAALIGAIVVARQ
ncbi:hypothetical protein ACB098_03G005000 [Castanea mollissima]